MRDGNGEKVESGTPGGTKGYGGVSGRVVMLWLGLIVAIAGLVVVTDRVARRDRSGGPPTSGPATGTVPASAPRK